MTQIEDIAKLVFRPGMTERDFFKQILIESKIRQTMSEKSATREEVEAHKGFRYFMRLLNEGNLDICPKHIFDNLYSMRRVISFKKIPEAQQEKMQKALQDEQFVQLLDQDQGFVSANYVAQQERGFLHRYPRNRAQKGWSTTEDVKGRFSINADMNPDLIKVLDRFCCQHKAHYKTAYPGRWADRVDPVTVYMYEPMTDKLKKELVSIMKPFVRNEKPEAHNLLDGESLFPGINCDKELSQAEGMAFIKTMPKRFQQDAIQFTNIETAPMSLGARKVLEEFLDMYQKYAPRLKTNTKVPVTKIPTPNAPAPRVPAKPTPQRAPALPQKPTTKSPVDKLKPQRFIVGRTGVSGCKYLDEKGNVIITETYHANCVKRVYANGLTMQMWHNPPSTTYTDGSKTGKDATEIMVTEMGRGCTKDVSTTGALKRKIEEVRKAGLLVTALPDTPKRTSTLKGRMMRHSVDNARTTMARTGGSRKAPSA